MTPLIRKAADFAIVIGVSAALAFIIIASANSLVAKVGVWKSYAVWLAFISRPDIIATTLLAVAVTMAVMAWQQGRVRR